MMYSNFLSLIVAVSRDPALKARAAEHPESVLDHFHVEPEVRAMLKARDLDAVKVGLHEALDEAITHASEPPHDLTPWWTDATQITYLDPLVATVGRLKSFTVEGKGWYPGEQALLFESTVGTVADVNINKCTSSPDGTFQMVITACFSQPGNYTLWVVSLPDHARRISYSNPVVVSNSPK